MSILLFLVLLVGIGIGILLAVSSGWISTIRGRDSKELRHIRKNLSLAEAGLRKAANPFAGDSRLEADLALREIDSSNYDYMEGN